MKKNEKSRLAISWICLIFFSLNMSACHPGMMDQIFAPRPKGEIKYDCSPRPDDPEGYVVKVCEYLNENQMWVGRNAGLVVSEVIEAEVDGRKVIILRFACCGTGDSASIDKETGEVLGYSLGIY
ncbi:MAG: hypothetical protein GTO18_08100 [Anaerolineales bacterium]|nr:hypothetical protein [Anaerolineales bacterium]